MARFIIRFEKTQSTDSIIKGKEQFEQIGEVGVYGKN